MMMWRYKFITMVVSMVTALSVTAIEVPSTSVLLPGIDREAMQTRLDNYDLQPLEGIWYYPNEQLTLAVERCFDIEHIAYRLILLESDDISLLPGTVIGFVATTALKNKFQLWLYSQRNDKILADPLECVATLSTDGGSFTFVPPRIKVKLRINFARFLPTIFRGVSVIPTIEKEQLPIGFVKVYPTEGNVNNKIIYL